MSTGEDEPFYLSVPSRIGGSLLHVSGELGGMIVLAARLLRRLLPPRVDRDELVKNLHKTGVRSVGIVTVTAIFVGAIMVIQAAPLVMRFNAKEIVGWGAGFATLREVGPLLIALMFSGRVGANNTAELGTMVVTDQIDALRALAIDPVSYLILPRVISMIVMLFLLTIVGDAVAIVGAIGAAKVLLDVDPRSFVSSLTVLLDEWDLATGLIKSVAFGVMIALTSCHFGLSVKGGAPGVGRAVNAAVVAAASGIFVLDYFSTYLLG
ncbi:MlaE family ABC transporter permease [Sandaracinus amylolyticus]|uniref:ABC-type transport protein in resistance to organic solvent n=1 Tax=Sandaracinus amylolyticus TaxID=927083 RepID=A0A0F6W4I5_9BACT|nr:ABC transporter permease [Sandaracinus amylolyticus]AKF07096.1 ABC-type transport protein in resistance to organic solvent [Sandaracinus amylolyticus]